MNNKLTEDQWKNLKLGDKIKRTNSDTSSSNNSIKIKINDIITITNENKNYETLNIKNIKDGSTGLHFEYFTFIENNKITKKSMTNNNCATDFLELKELKEGNPDRYELVKAELCDKNGQRTEEGIKLEKKLMSDLVSDSMVDVAREMNKANEKNRKK